MTRKINIATAFQTKKKGVWNNEAVDWRDFADRLSRFHRTAERMVDYQQMRKEDKEKTKEQAGGYVGGPSISHDRGQATIRRRDLITLDAD